MLCQIIQVFSKVGAGIRAWAEETSSVHLFSGKVLNHDHHDDDHQYHHHQDHPAQDHHHHDHHVDCPGLE